MPTIAPGCIIIRPTLTGPKIIKKDRLFLKIVLHREATGPRAGQSRNQQLSCWSTTVFYRRVASTRTGTFPTMTKFQTFSKTLLLITRCAPLRNLSVRTTTIHTVVHSTTPTSITVITLALTRTWRSKRAARGLFPRIVTISWRFNNPRLSSDPAS